ncbi:retron St85 family effector protein [Clostridium sp. KNHs214]|uniref:retron St85 family effector protein n=1 Tax=Clostridium sp. KNHs214 TaxID=1540257 RepID=UPI000556DC80|nr:retron St85 family effector protein [Clostridium sp. KNHs214]
MGVSEIYLDSIDKIYTDIYKKINREYTDVFLCGGVSTNENCLRDWVRIELEKNKIRVLYPEDLFMDILNKDKKMDLLSLENFLAENSDIICVMPESSGSLVELGAFTNNEKTLEKLFVIMDKYYKKQKSFIMMGPIKYISNQREKDRIIFYDRDKLDSLIKFILDKFKKFSREFVKKDIEINTIIGQYYYIPLLVYFVKSISMVNIEKIMKRLYKKDNYETENLNMILYTAIKLLYKNKLVHKNIRNGEISLTKKGNVYIQGVLNNLPISNSIKLYDFIRYGIMLTELTGNTPLESTI